MDNVDLTACDREPIHIPGAVQPHGVLLVLSRESERIEQAGGICGDYFDLAPASLIGRSFGSLDRDGSRDVDFAHCSNEPSYVGGIVAADGRDLDVVAHLVADKLVVEIEAAPGRRRSGAQLARNVEAVGAMFRAAKTLDQLCQTAAFQFRELTGFDRVMIYRFLPDETGSVIAEAKADDLPAFLHHRYPASDIPRQARALYVRNVIRVIPDAKYVPSPLVKEDRGEPPLDMSNCHLRSVSPIHLQYLANMGVVASASISIIRDGELWGLVACHHGEPKYLSFDDRTQCRLLAGILSQQVTSFEEAELYRERLRARAAEDELLTLLARETSADDMLASHAEDLMRTIPSHGAAVRRQDRLWIAGRTPSEAEVMALSDWLLRKPAGNAFATAELGEVYPPAIGFTGTAAGLLAATIDEGERYQLLWFRAEQVEVIEWAGNPHKAVEPGGTGVLTPRKSFDAWRETVRGRAEAWSPTEIEAADRLARAVAELHRTHSINRLNATLQEALKSRDRQLAEKDSLLREGDHRIQNSLHILGSMLTMQLRQTTDPVVRPQLEEALSRVQAVSAVHRRLHRTNQPQVIDVDSYLKELLNDIGRSLGPESARELRVHSTPLPVPTEVAMSLGLIVTELVLNAAKYAYDGRSGPVEVTVEGGAERLRVRVRDYGKGQTSTRPQGTGFGSRLMASLVDRLNGELRRSDAAPGLSVTIEMPLRSPRVPGAAL